MASTGSARLASSQASSCSSAPSRAALTGPYLPRSLTPSLKPKGGAISLRALCGELFGSTAALPKSSFQSPNTRPWLQRRGVSAILESSGMGPHMFDEFNEADQEFAPATLIPASECMAEGPVLIP